jgi:glycosyltransferase involved in cell wall biosynthesis
VQLSPQKKSFFSKWYSKLLLLFNRYMASKMDVFVALSSESIKEWNIKNHGVIIPNPNWLKTDQKANLNAKKILIVARHSYEKGLDRFLDIWKKLAPKYPDWCVEIIGKDVEKSDLQKMASVMGISNSITFFTPTHKIETKYLDASIYVMTSRFEAFPMVLIEAMACGLPTIAYDCPCGPRAIIQDNINGLLIDNGDEKKFSTALESLMNSYQLREMLGENAKKSILKYEVGHIMKTWDELLKAF